MPSLVTTAFAPPRYVATVVGITISVTAKRLEMPHSNAAD